MSLRKVASDLHSISFGSQTEWTQWKISKAVCKASLTISQAQIFCEWLCVVALPTTSTRIEPYVYVVAFYYAWYSRLGPNGLLGEPTFNASALINSDRHPHLGTCLSTELATGARHKLWLRYAELRAHHRETRAVPASEYRPSSALYAMMASACDHQCDLPLRTCIESVVLTPTPFNEWHEGAMIESPVAARSCRLRAASLESYLNLTPQVSQPVPRLIRARETLKN